MWFAWIRSRLVGFIGHVERLARPASATVTANITLSRRWAGKRAFARSRNLHPAPFREAFRRRAVDHQSGKPHRKVFGDGVPLVEVFADHGVFASREPMANRRSLAGDFADPREMGNTLQVPAVMPSEKSAAFNCSDGRDHVADPFPPFNRLKSPFQSVLNVRKRISALKCVANRANAVFDFAHLPPGFTVFGRN